LRIYLRTISPHCAYSDLVSCPLPLQYVSPPSIYRIASHIIHAQCTTKTRTTMGRGWSHMQCDDDLRAIWRLAARGGAVKTKRTFDPEAKSSGHPKILSRFLTFCNLFHFSICNGIIRVPRSYVKLCTLYCRGNEIAATTRNNTLWGWRARAPPVTRAS